MKFNAQTILSSLGQVALIFIGVSVAIWFENLNDKWKEESFEKVLLAEMSDKEQSTPPGDH